VVNLFRLYVLNLHGFSIQAVLPPTSFTVTRWAATF
jgi:hypothetical protein